MYDGVAVVSTCFMTDQFRLVMLRGFVSEDAAAAAAAARPGWRSHGNRYRPRHLCRATGKASVTATHSVFITGITQGCCLSVIGFDDGINAVIIYSSWVLLRPCAWKDAHSLTGLGDRIQEKGR